MDTGAKFGIEFRGGRRYTLKKFVEIQENEIAEQINALDDLDDVVLEDDDGFEDDALLSLEF